MSRQSLFEAKELSAAVSALINGMPFFGQLLLDICRLKESTIVPTAGTDGRNIYVNPQWFASLTVEDGAFVLAHEVGHIIFKHAKRGKYYKDIGAGPDNNPWDHSRGNIAMDLIINDMLLESGFKRVPANGYHDKNIGTANDLMEDVYCRLPQQQGGGGGGGAKQPGGKKAGSATEHGGFDTHMEPAPEDGEDGQPSDAEVMRAIVSAANTARAMGKLPAGLARIIDEITNPSLTWQELLRDTMTKVLSHETSTWARPHRRRLVYPGVYMASATGYATGEVALIADTSGSISNDVLAAWLGECAGILEDCRPKALHVLWTDAKVHRVDTLRNVEDLRSIESAPGGGGTDMRVAIDYIKEHLPDVQTIVCLTDGFTPFPENDDIPCPSIWVVTDIKPEDVPCGTAIKLEAA